MILKGLHGYPLVTLLIKTVTLLIIKGLSLFLDIFPPFDLFCLLGTDCLCLESVIDERDVVADRETMQSRGALSQLMASSVKLTGDVKAFRELPRAITHAAKQTIITVLQESVPVVQQQIKSVFVVRGTWYLESNRYGIHVRYPRNRDDLSGRLETPADWLEEHETSGTRTPDKHRGHLAIPQIGAARPTIGSVVPAALKPRRLLPNASLIDSRALIRVSGRPSTNQGKRFTFKQTPFFLNRKGTAIFERLPDHHLKLFYTLTRSAHIKKESAVTEPTVKHVLLRFGPIFDTKLAETVKFRQIR